VHAADAIRASGGGEAHEVPGRLAGLCLENMIHHILEIIHVHDPLIQIATST
jgi:hypothetical protein